MKVDFTDTVIWSLSVTRKAIVFIHVAMELYKFALSIPSLTNVNQMSVEPEHTFLAHVPPVLSIQ